MNYVAMVIGYTLMVAASLAPIGALLWFAAELWAKFFMAQGVINDAYKWRRGMRAGTRQEPRVLSRKGDL